MPAARKRRKGRSETQPSAGLKPKPRKTHSITVIGAGRMGTALGRALHAKNYRINLVVTIHKSSARRAAKLVGGGATPATAADLNSSPEAVRQLNASRLLLIATPDDTLESVVETLVGLAGAKPEARQKGQLVALHTSGAVSSEVLSPLRRLGFAVGSLHPLVSVADAATPDPFTGAHFCLEGDPAAIKRGRSLVRDLGGHSFTIATEHKPLYHAAAAISSGHAIALIDVAIEMLERCNLSGRRAQQILMPLLKSTFENLERSGPAKAMTGPISRGDSATTQKHLAAMERAGLADTVDIYAALGLRATKLVRPDKTKTKQLTRITKLLVTSRRQTRS